MKELCCICFLVIAFTGKIFAQNNELAELGNGSSSWLPIASPDEDITKCEDICSLTDNLFAELGIADLEEEGLSNYFMNLAQNSFFPNSNSVGLAAFAAPPPIPNIKEAPYIKKLIDGLFQTGLITPEKSKLYGNIVREIIRFHCHDHNPTADIVERILAEAAEAAKNAEKVLPPASTLPISTTGKFGRCARGAPYLVAIFATYWFYEGASEASCKGKNNGEAIEAGLLKVFYHGLMFDLFDACDSLIYNYFKKPKPESPVHFISIKRRCIDGQCPQSLSGSEYKDVTGDESLDIINGRCPELFPQYIGKPLFPLPILNGQGESCSYQVVCCLTPDCRSKAIVDNGVISIKKCPLEANTPENTNQ